MTWTIAIHPDDYTVAGDPTRCDAASPRWAALLDEIGHRVKWVDVRRGDILDQLNGCHGFMWRWAHFGGMGRIARRLLPVIEKELGISVYPDQDTCWHYDDKIAQTYLLRATNIPTPRTWVWYDPEAAKEWAGRATYPLVLKLAAGAGSSNVRLLQDSGEACLWITRLFRHRIADLSQEQFQPLTWKRRIRTAGRIFLKGALPLAADNGFELQSGCILFQEFLPGNSFDTRITVIGNRAFGFRRYNRNNDFRASGSGKIDWDPKSIDLGFVRLAFRTARQLRTQSCAIDGLLRGKDLVVGEISYTYASWAVEACPGHWELEGDPVDGSLRWVPGPMWAEEAQVQDFLKLLERNPTSKKKVAQSDGQGG